MANMISFSWINRIRDYVTPSESETPSAAAKNQTQELIVQVTDAAKDAGIFHVLNKATFDYQITSGYNPPSPTKHLEVGRNRSVVVGTDSPKPYVTTIDRSIIIQMRGLDSHGSLVTLGLAYVDTQLNPLKTALEETLNQTDGNIEIFISGGTGASEKMYQAVRQYIENVKAAHRDRIQLNDDYFKATDFGAWINGPKESIGKGKIYRAGFDLNNAPFMIIDYQNKANFTIDKSE